MEAKRTTREFLYGLIRAAIQIGAAVVAWFLYVGLDIRVAVLLVWGVLMVLGIVRAERFERLYAERWRWIREDKVKRYYLPTIALVVIGFVILFPIGDFMRMNVDWIIYVLLVGIGLWDEVWLAHRRYRAR